MEKFVFLIVIIKKNKKTQYQVLATTCKETGSIHSHPYKKKKAEQTESKGLSFLGPIRKFRLRTDIQTVDSRE